MLPDKKSTSFTWLQGVRRSARTAENRSETISLTDDHAMDIDSSPMVKTTQEPGKENADNGKRLTGISTSALFSRAPLSFRIYQNMQDLIEEEETDKDGPVPTNSCKAAASTSSMGKKFNKTLKDVKISIGNLSQRLKKSTRRHYVLSEFENDLTPTRRILGRTPTKLYSPFDFDSPVPKSPNRRYVSASTPNQARKFSMRGPVRLHSPKDKNFSRSSKKDMRTPNSK